MNPSEMTNEQLDKYIADKKGKKVCQCAGHYCNCEFGIYPYRPTTDPRPAMELLDEMENPQIMRVDGEWRVTPDCTARLSEYIIGTGVNLCRAIAEAYAGLP